MIAFERNEQLGITVLTDKDLNKALTLDLSLECDDQVFRNLQTQVLSNFQKASTKQRLHSLKYKKTLEQILLNLIRCYQMDSDYFLIFPQDNEHYSNDRYNPLKITRQISIELINWLQDQKYLKGIKGRWYTNSTGLTSRVRPTSLLKKVFIAHNVEHFKITNHPKSEVIFLKGVKHTKNKPAKYIDYKRCSQEATSSRGVIKKYNELMNKIVIANKGKQLPVSYFHIYRVFNNADWKQGGRYYGQFSQMSKKPTKPSQIDRTKILINGNKIIELDFSQIHPTMLYNKVGKPLINDPYIPTAAYTGVHRDFIKAVFNIMINCSGKAAVYGACAKESDDTKYTGLNINSAFITKLISDLESTHNDIRQFFYSGEGLRLQHTDSIIATKVIDNFVSQDRPIIPFHDSFIVESKYGTDLKQVMQSSFQQVMGFGITIK